jgi:hypothetical protein
MMEQEHVHVGQRIRVNVPGVGDHGQVGTVKKLRGNQCFVHLDWDQRLQHTVMFYAADLDRVPDEPVLGRKPGV